MKELKFIAGSLAKPFLSYCSVSFFETLFGLWTLKHFQLLQFEQGQFYFKCL